MIHIFKHIPDTEKRITISTIFTLARMGLTPCIVTAMVLQYWGTAFILFLIAAFTDLLDGALARLLNQKTFLGACLDALADKILIVSCFATLAFVQSPLFTIPRWFVKVILLKESILILGATAIYYMHGIFNLRATWLGKSTMAAQVMFIIWLFACYFFHWLPVKTYYGMLGLLLILVLGSLMHYCLIGAQYIVRHKGFLV